MFVRFVPSFDRPLITPLFSRFRRLSRQDLRLSFYFAPALKDPPQDEVGNLYTDGYPHGCHLCRCHIPLRLMHSV